MYVTPKIFSVGFQITWRTGAQWWSLVYLKQCKTEVMPGVRLITDT